MQLTSKESVFAEAAQILLKELLDTRENISRWAFTSLIMLEVAIGNDKLQICPADYSSISKF